LAILQAAHRLFAENGYPATTMQAVAAEAEVAAKTVYLAFSTKAALLRAVWDLALKGDTDDAPVAQREWYREILEERDPDRKVRLLARNSCNVKRRIGPLLRAIRSAAAVDDDSAALWALIQSDFYDNQRVIVETLARDGALRADLNVSKATDILWMLNHPDTWLLLTGDRGWSPEVFEEWFATTASQQLIAPRGPRRPTTRP
jgi:AcrR family transcriptional regulator